MHLCHKTARSWHGSAAASSKLDFDRAANTLAAEQDGFPCKSELMIAAACVGLVALGAPARAQSDDDTEKGIEQYRRMLKEDPWSNPGLLDADRGEALWKTPAGPNKVSLEKCDLGKGAGRGRRRLRRAAEIFRRRRPRHGPRDAADVVHGEIAGRSSTPTW